MTVMVNWRDFTVHPRGFFSPEEAFSPERYLRPSRWHSLSSTVKNHWFKSLKSHHSNTQIYMKRQWVVTCSTSAYLAEVNCTFWLSHGNCHCSNVMDFINTFLHHHYLPSLNTKPSIKWINHSHPHYPDHFLWLQNVVQHSVFSK